MKEQQLIEWGVHRSNQSWQYRLIKENQPDFCEVLDSEHDQYLEAKKAAKQTAIEAKKLAFQQTQA